MYKCLAFWVHSTEFQDANPNPNHFPREIKFFSRMWVPTELFSNPDLIGVKYTSYLESCINPNGTFKTDTVPMMSKKFSGSILLNKRSTAQGAWHTFKVYIDIPTIAGFTHFNTEFPDMSFCGAAFGFVLNQVTHTARNLALNPGTLELFKMWRNYNWLPLGVPLYYEIDNFAISLINAVPEESSHVSMSNISKLPLRLALSQINSQTVVTNILENENLGLTPGERRGFHQAQIFALLLEKKLDEFLERAREQDYVITASDDVWLFDGLRPKAGNNTIKLALYSSFYKKSKPTGCRNKGSRLHRIFAKSKKIRSVLIFNPVGLNEEGGRNCVLECLAYHLKEHPNLDSPSVEEFWQNPEINLLILDTFDINDSELLVKINQIVKFNIICYYEESIVGGFNSIKELHWPIYSANSDAPPLRLLCYQDGNDVFGNPVWHACVVSEFGKLKTKLRCKVCGEWFNNTSAHFGKCKTCDFCFRAYVEGGNHYLSCKGRQQKLKKTAEEMTLMEPSRIDHKEWQLWKNVWFCDFECFQNKQGNHIPYLAVIKSIAEEKSYSFWGENCLRKFVEFVIDPRNKVTGYLYCHNGSGYDFNIILSGMIRWNPRFSQKTTNVLMRGNKILTCQISTKPPLTLRDTYLLAPAALSRLCRDLKIKQEFAKTVFDHSKITSFETAENHKDEVVKYCIQDVLALEQIFKLFSRAMWEIAPVLLQSSMSLASHALEMWKKIEAGPALSSLVLPSYDIYLILREMYHGGRVLATLPKYDSALWEYVTQEDESGEFTFFDADGVSLLDFVEICEKAKQLTGKECIKQVDVVSLYPHVMHDQEFPTGPFFAPIFWAHEADAKRQAYEISQTIHWGKYAEIEHDGNLIQAENPGYTILKKEMFRHCYKVDMACPENLIVAFLMRKVNDTPVQNLAPLKDYWVTGVELFEAIKVGYTLEKVHAKFGWDTLSPVFRKYIGILFKLKEDNKKDKTSIMYIVAKLLMNALSGKFGQKIVSRVTKLMAELPEDPDKEFENLMNITTQLIESVDDKGEQLPIGYFFTGEKQKADMETNLPTHLSVFILAHSRRKMSKMLRYTGGYYDSSKTLMYTDTDSMVVTESTFQILKKGGFIGSKLGQLEDEFPKELIVAGRFLAPKCYALAVLKQVPNSNKCAIAYKIRSKGIPHRGDLFFANSYHLDEREFSVQVSELEESISGPVKDLGKKFYVLREKSTDKIIMVHPFINISICDMILSEKYYLQVHFGSIVKNTKIKFTLQSKWVSRSMGFNSWWNNPDCPRILKDEQGYEITGCKTQQ